MSNKSGTKARRATGNAGDNESEVGLRVVVPELTITKVVTPSVGVVYHSEVTYTVVLSNGGDGEALGVVLTDVLIFP